MYPNATILPVRLPLSWHWYLFSNLVLDGCCGHVDAIGQVITFRGSRDLDVYGSSVRVLKGMRLATRDCDTRRRPWSEMEGSDVLREGGNGIIEVVYQAYPELSEDTACHCTREYHAW